MVFLTLAADCGFTAACIADPSTLLCSPAVREACAEGKCGAYGRNWTCPPACGTLAQCEVRIRRYENAVLLQTTGSTDDAFDPEGYARIEADHQAHLQQFAAALRRQFPDALVLGAGGCRICKTCAYPEPCRFPERALSSMEAYGLLVTEVCKKNGLRYYYGPETMTFTACALW